MEKCKRPPRNHWDRYLGQPIQILADDGVRYCGTLLSADRKGITIIDQCERVVFISYRHVDAIVEPMMELAGFCGASGCACGREDCDGSCGQEPPLEEEEEEDCGCQKGGYRWDED